MTDKEKEVTILRKYAKAVHGKKWSDMVTDHYNKHLRQALEWADTIGDDKSLDYRLSRVENLPE